MATAAAAAVVEASEAIRGPGQPQSRDTLTGMERPTRIVETEGFERLFSHYTGLQGEELLEYLRNFQEKACEVGFLPVFADLGLSIWMYSEWRIRRPEGTSAL